VDLQLVLPPTASHKSLQKLLPPAAAACTDSSHKSCCSSDSSCTQCSSSTCDTGNAQPDAVQQPDAVVLHVQPQEPAAATVQSAKAAAAAMADGGSKGSSSAPEAAAAAGDADLDDEGLCTICYDQPATCVLMECGHGGYCWRCAHLLFARPPSECPVCRQPIMQVGTLGGPARKCGIAASACVAAVILGFAFKRHRGRRYAATVFGHSVGTLTSPFHWFFVWLDALSVSTHTRTRLVRRRRRRMHWVASMLAVAPVYTQ
jgi:hypothetical protein